MKIIIIIIIIIIISQWFSSLVLFFWLLLLLLIIITLIIHLHLADAFIQSDLQMRTIEAIKINRAMICKCYNKSQLA